MIKKGNAFLYSIFGMFLMLNVAFWFYAHDIKNQWANVPPVPDENKAVSFSLGDRGLAYRSFALMLQNLGDSGGTSQSFQNYNYERLGRWFFLEHKMDPISNAVPLLAAFYYGATPVAEDLDPVIAYLAEVGMDTRGEKWRWLAQAVYLSRFSQKDSDKALELAYILASHPQQDRPAWTYQMPAFVLAQSGDKEAAYNLLVNLLADRADKLHPAEVAFTKDYICDRVLTKKDREHNPLCTGLEE